MSKVTNDKILPKPKTTDPQPGEVKKTPSPEIVKPSPDRTIQPKK